MRNGQQVKARAGVPKGSKPNLSAAARSIRVCPHCGTVLPREDQLASRPSAPRELTDRQKEVLRLIATGFTAAAAGKQLNLSSRTIEFHKISIMEKLGLRSVSELTIYAIANQLIRP